MNANAVQTERTDSQPVGAKPGELLADLGLPDVVAGNHVQDSKSESGTWLGALPQDKRNAILSLHQIDLRWNWVLLVHPALWVLAATMMVCWPSTPVRLLGYVVIGSAIHAMATLMHEGIHGTLFRNRSLDRVVGFLMGAPALFSFTAYKVAHLIHHRHNRTEKDPDEFTNYSRSRLMQSLLFYSWGIVGMLIYLFHIPATALTRGRPADRRSVIIEYLLLLGIYAGVFVVAARNGRVDLVVHLWILPMCVAILFGNLRGWAEHTMTRAGHPLTQSRTVTSNGVVSFMMCNLNYHLEHHLCPGIPWYNLPKLHTLLQPEYKEAGSFIYQSYLQFLWDAVRVGVHGIAPIPSH